MKLDQVQVTQFRNLSSCSIKPASHLNLVVGKNGSGKSSLLEALYYLSNGRSFRTNRFQSLVQHQHENFVLYASTLNEVNGVKGKVGVQRSLDGAVEMQINGQRQSKISALASLIPTQIFTPQSSDLISGAPSLRRSYLDWGLFHVEHSFLNISTRYVKVLKQRNANLKGDKFDRTVDDIWCQQLGALGMEITLLRRSYIEQISLHINSQLQQFLPEFSVEIAYYSGWDKSLELHQAIAKQLIKDRQYGYTSSGPHKADLKLKVEGRPVFEVMSRGQLRMLTAALQLAQSRLLFERRQVGGLYLLDDIGAELDTSKRQLFINTLINTNAQMFITATDNEQVSFLNDYDNKKVFHVEQGQVNEEKTING
ncbi:DNA replication/repair protein RecF [Alteromonadaceae bacterium BrNp21-10]|nr:DNA replication/repair protein RecF [Alteromonadaceae bacterium BrNp21-10]